MKMTIAKYISFLLGIGIWYLGIVSFLLVKTNAESHTMIYHAGKEAVIEASQSFYLPKDTAGFYENNKKYIQGPACAVESKKGTFSELHKKVYQGVYKRITDERFLYYSDNSICITTWFHRANGINIRIEGTQGFYPIQINESYHKKYIQVFKTEASNAK